MCREKRLTSPALEVWTSWESGPGIKCKDNSPVGKINFSIPAGLGRRGEGPGGEGRGLRASGWGQLSQYENSKPSGLIQAVSSSLINASPPILAWTLLQRPLPRRQTCVPHLLTGSTPNSPPSQQPGFVVVVHLLSHVWLFVTPWTAACQAPLAMGIFQARTLEWVAISLSRGSSGIRDWTHVSFTGRWIPYHRGSPNWVYVQRTPAGKDKLRQRGALPTAVAEPSQQAPAGVGGAGGGLVHNSDHTSWVPGYRVKTVVRNLQVRGHQNCWEVREWLMTGCCGGTRLPGGRRKSTKYRGMGVAVPRQRPQGAHNSDWQHTGGQVEGTAPQTALTGKLGQRSEEEDGGWGQTVGYCSSSTTNQNQGRMMGMRRTTTTTKSCPLSVPKPIPRAEAHWLKKMLESQEEGPSTPQQMHLVRIP